jgi:ATP-dependent DNA helicase RecG
LDFFKAAGLYREDFTSNISGFTLAALLLFGKEEAIQSMLPHYKIDALVRKVDTNRYDHRLTIRCNLITAYEELMLFISNYLPDKFYLEGGRRMSLRENIFRELIANFLIHREYINPRVSTIEILADKCILKNANKPHLYGQISPDNYESYPKNPHLAKFFVQMARAEDLGTGIRNVFHLSTLYSGEKPVFNEEDLFEVIIPIGNEKTTPNTTPNTTTNTTPNTRTKIIELLIDKPTITKKEIAEILNISVDGVKYHIRILKAENQIGYEGTSRDGKWIVLNKQG